MTVKKYLFYLPLLLSIPLLTSNCSEAPTSTSPETDHLYMSLEFQDSTLLVEALYTLEIDDTTASLMFLLNPGFSIESISASGLDTFSLAPKPGYPIPFWKLDFTEILNPGTQVEISFSYNIDLASQNHMKSGWIELNADKLWFPNKGALNNEFSYDVSINGFPKGYSLVSHMDSEIVYSGDENIEISRKEPWFEVLILAGADMIFWNPDQSATDIFTSNETPDSTLHSIRNKVRESIKLMNESFGNSDPIDTFRVVLRNTPRSELGFQFNRSNMIITGADFDSYGNLSHEVAHYWWTGADFIQEPWLNESFANYSMYLVLEKYDTADLRQIIQRYTKISENAPPVCEATLFSENSYPAYYNKGSILLKNLEEMIGKEQMLSLLMARLEKNINTSSGLLDELESRHGTEIRNSFERMLCE